jgi:hypothetical protein
MKKLKHIKLFENFGYKDFKQLEGTTVHSITHHGSYMEIRTNEGVFQVGTAGGATLAVDKGNIARLENPKYETILHTVTEIGNYGLRLEFESWSPLEVSDDTGGEGLEISFLGK